MKSSWAARCSLVSGGGVLGHLLTVLIRETLTRFCVPKCFQFFLHSSVARNAAGGQENMPPMRVARGLSSPADKARLGSFVSDFRQSRGTDRGRPSVKDAVAEQQEIDRCQCQHRNQVNLLGGESQRRGQQPCAGGSRSILRAGCSQIASELMWERQRKLFAMGPHKHPLQGEVDSQSRTEPDCKRHLKR